MSGRPQGSFGPVAMALLAAAEAAGPAPVTTLAARAGVGFAAARYTASRLVDTGALVRRSESRPALLDVPRQDVPSPADFSGAVLDRDTIELLTVSMWRT